MGPQVRTSNHLGQQSFIANKALCKAQGHDVLDVLTPGKVPDASCCLNAIRTDEQTLACQRPAQIAGIIFMSFVIRMGGYKPMWCKPHVYIGYVLRAMAEYSYVHALLCTSSTSCNLDLRLTCFKELTTSSHTSHRYPNHDSAFEHVLTRCWSYWTTTVKQHSSAPD